MSIYFCYFQKKKFIDNDDGGGEQKKQNETKILSKHDGHKLITFWVNKQVIQFNLMFFLFSFFVFRLRRTVLFFFTLTTK